MRNFLYFALARVSALALALPLPLLAQATLPRPDHVVVVIYENHSFAQIFGNADAPCINAFANDDHSATFLDSYGITHPSQPNYLDLYAGCDQGIDHNFVPLFYPFTSDNLGRQLIDSGYTWATYSEDLPSVGWDGETHLAYVRRHNPATNWVGTDTNQIPATTNQPFTAFPSDFDSLPTACFVIPNLNHDMQDGSIATGDTWFHDHIEPYAQWAKTHNSLLIFTFDEDDGILISTNHILTIFGGQNVAPGQYNDTINHYSVLRTIEEMYGLPYACNAASATTITNCWMPTAVTPIAVNAGPQVDLYPNPSNGRVTVAFEDYRHSRVEVLEVNGKVLHSAPLSSPRTDLALDELAVGLYLVKVTHPKGVATQRLMLE